MLGLTILTILAFMAILAPLFTGGENPSTIRLKEINRPPTAAHILGTDGVGRDGWTRLVYGARVSLAVGLVAVGIQAIIGVTLGSIAGYLGGRVDNLIMRFTDVMMCFPTLLLIITAAVVLPPSIFNIMAIIGLFGWTGLCRLARGQMLALRKQDFVIAAVCVGQTWPRIVVRHMLPNIVGPIVVACTLGLAGAIMTEATLSFLGLGVQEPMPSWGSTLQTALELPVLQGMPWRWIPSALAIAITVLSVNFAGDGLRDALDPRMSLG